MLYQRKENDMKNFNMATDEFRPLSHYAKKFKVATATIRNWREFKGLPNVLISGHYYSTDKWVGEWVNAQQTGEGSHIGMSAKDLRKKMKKSKVKA
jgi:hypothetical protein|tara:strand:- start:230 stop:517 length:288 start_codon:yes stop_codon:yes gene_type:complete